VLGLSLIFIVFLLFGFLVRILFCTAGGGSSFRHATRRHAQEKDIILLDDK
jgi:hypothetical protein